MKRMHPVKYCVLLLQCYRAQLFPKIYIYKKKKKYINELQSHVGNVICFQGHKPKYLT